MAKAERTGRNVVILDDNIELHRYDWLDRTRILSVPAGGRI